VHQICAIAYGVKFDPITMEFEEPESLENTGNTCKVCEKSEGFTVACESGKNKRQIALNDNNDKSPDECEHFAHPYCALAKNTPDPEEWLVDITTSFEADEQEFATPFLNKGNLSNPKTEMHWVCSDHKQSQFLCYSCIES
jgi:hypothetical protein